MNPLAPYFEMEDQGTHFKFTPTKSFERLRKVQNPKSKKADWFLLEKATDFIKISMNMEETKSITPLWKFKDGKWVIYGQSNYRGGFFDQHPIIIPEPKEGVVIKS